MKKILYLIIVLLCSSQYIILADDCSDALSEAKSLYNNGNYAKAKSLFEYVKSECGSSYGDATNWIAKCNDALTPKLSLSRTSISAGASGITEYITVTCNTTWEVQHPTGSMYSVTRNGNSLTVKINANSSTESRSDYFNVKTTDGSKVQKITLSQTGKSSYNNSSLSYTHSGGNVYKLIGTTRTYTDKATALSHLTENIKKWEQCRTGAITSVGKGVVVYAKNGYAFTGIPNDLSEKIKYANDNSLRIHDVCMSSNGNYWCIAYGDGGWRSCATTSFNEKMKACHSTNEKIVSISINNSGEWVIVTDKHLYASSTTFQNKLSEVSDLFGYIYSVALTEMGYVICADRGVYYHNIPTKVLEKIKEMASTKIIKVLKYTDDGTVLLTDGESSCRYYM